MQRTVGLHEPNPPSRKSPTTKRTIGADDRENDTAEIPPANSGEPPSDRGGDGEPPATRPGTSFSKARLAVGSEPVRHCDGREPRKDGDDTTNRGPEVAPSVTRSLAEIVRADVV
jgi:hypothetical protein